MPQTNGPGRRVMYARDRDGNIDWGPRRIAALKAQRVGPPETGIGPDVSGSGDEPFSLPTRGGAAGPAILVVHNPKTEIAHLHAGRARIANKIGPAGTEN
jgi:hypothetical protein